MSTTVYADLEIGLESAGIGTGHYQAELRFNDPNSEAEVRPERGAVVLDDGELLDLHFEPDEYSRKLTQGLFHAENIRALFARAMAVAEAQGAFLRVCLRIGPTALELHALRWELLADPESLNAAQPRSLANSERTLFSRFMASNDWRPVRLRPKSDLRALVAVASPSDSDRYNLAEIDVEVEIRRAQEALGDIPVEVAGRDEPLTLDLLLEKLRGSVEEPGVDLLYLACHGLLSRKNVPHLLLQDEDGKTARVEGEALAQGIAELQHPPRLAFLASCESARRENTSADSEGRQAAESALAPRLADAGIPALVAMQGRISMETVDRALPTFFRELVKDGQIDRAMAVARAKVRDRHDAWMPALYTRLKRGQLWYVPGFEGGDFTKWKAIASNVNCGDFIPILGPEVGEHIYGSPREVARKLSERHGFPLAPHETSDIAKVAQYLAVDQSSKFARDQIVKQFHRQLLGRTPDLAEHNGKSFPKLLDARVEGLAPDDPFRILADLPASIYVTTSGDPLLLKAIRANQREPTALLGEWRPTAESHPQRPTYEGEPTKDEPIVYHVFGVLGKESSLVLTEDDYFDYLIAMSEYKLLPAVIRGNITRSSLLFLGFHLNDWTFRVLFRMIMTLSGSGHLNKYAHVGVQVDPSENDLLDVERTRKYFEQYYGSSPTMPSISIYWGTAGDFLKELQQQLRSIGETDQFPVIEKEDEDDWV